MSELITLRDAILRNIEAHQGLKGVELALKVMAMMGPSQFEVTQYEMEVMKLVNERQIIEVSYELAHMDYRTKSIYFPKGTKIHFTV